ncbi:hypothetical protein GpartN1_g1176.t1 [Galdieria partita]|uniref:Uncharacterized protein n=1 Tax=Galdieria partita TaxID=83374 RepID=A0A9C7UND2_9RHOD|nr:hypothetical protein GpartN1_g1176.t1 [Galdieria partita]
MAPAWGRCFGVVRNTTSLIKQTLSHTKKSSFKPNLVSNLKGNKDLTLAAVRDLTHQRVACRHIAKRCPSVSVTLSKNNCIVREAGKSSLATAAADSSTKGLASIEALDSSVTGAKALSLIGVDDDGLLDRHLVFNSGVNVILCISGTCFKRFDFSTIVGCVCVCR